MDGRDQDELGRLVMEALRQAAWDADAAAERLMADLGGGVRCLLALDRLADLAEQARRLTDAPAQVGTLLRLRVCYAGRGEHA